MCTHVLWTNYMDLELEKIFQWEMGLKVECISTIFVEAGPRSIQEPLT